jgi:hypothetical protein
MRAEDILCHNHRRIDDDAEVDGAHGEEIGGVAAQDHDDDAEEQSHGNRRQDSESSTLVNRPATKAIAAHTAPAKPTARTMRARQTRFAGEGGSAAAPCGGTSGPACSGVAAFASFSSIACIATAFLTLRPSPCDDREQKCSILRSCCNGNLYAIPLKARRPLQVTLKQPSRQGILENALSRTRQLGSAYHSLLSQRQRVTWDGIHLNRAVAYVRPLDTELRPSCHTPFHCQLNCIAVPTASGGHPGSETDSMMAFLVPS